MSEEIITEIKDQVAWISVNRPEVHNALSRDICHQLAAEIRSYSGDRSVRVIVLRGGGSRSFIAGADTREFSEALASPESALEYDANAELVQSAIIAAPQPVIAMIQGNAIGSGCIVATACDFRIASKVARFGIPVAKFGFLMPLPDVLRLSALIGQANTKLLLMTGRLLDAEAALAIGLINQLTEPENLQAATEAFARTLAENAPLSLKATKQILDHHSGITSDVYRASPWYEEIFRSEDFQEGLAAFSAKRKPVFHGN